MLDLDLGSEFGARVDRRLRTDTIAWLTTVGGDGTPQPSPVWFLWDGETALVYSRPRTGKLANIAANPRVSLSFNSDANGGDIVVLTGAAALATDAPAADQNPAYLDKYRAGILRIGMTPESFAAAYSVALRVRPERVRGH